MGPPRVADAVFRPITRFESNAGRCALGAGVRPAKRFLSTTLSTVVLLAVTGSFVVVDRNRLGFNVGFVYRLLTVLLLLVPLSLVSFCWYRLLLVLLPLPPRSSDLDLKPFRAADGGIRADCTDDEDDEEEEEEDELCCCLC